MDFDNTSDTDLSELGEFGLIKHFLSNNPVTAFGQLLEKIGLLLIPTSGHTGWKVPTKPTCLLEKVSTSLGIKSV